MIVCKHGGDALDSHVVLRNILKSNINSTFSVLKQSHLNIWELGEFLKVMQTLDKVKGFHNCLEFFEPTSFSDVTMETMEKVLYSLN